MGSPVDFPFESSAQGTALLGCSENWPWSLQLLDAAEASQISSLAVGFDGIIFGFNYF